MTHVILDVDGKIELDEDLNEWQATPPDYFKDKLRPDVTPESWLKGVMIVMAEAAGTGDDVKITVKTGAAYQSGNRDWLMEVKWL